MGSCNIKTHRGFIRISFFIYPLLVTSTVILLILSGCGNEESGTTNTSLPKSRFKNYDGGGTVPGLIGSSISTKASEIAALLRDPEVAAGIKELLGSNGALNGALETSTGSSNADAATKAISEALALLNRMVAAAENNPKYADQMNDLPNLLAAIAKAAGNLSDNAEGASRQQIVQEVRQIAQMVMDFIRTLFKKGGGKSGKSKKGGKD